jgi:hypothetical protein
MVLCQLVATPLQGVANFLKLGQLDSSAMVPLIRSQQLHFEPLPFCRLRIVWRRAWGRI